MSNKDEELHDDNLFYVFVKLGVEEEYYIIPNEIVSNRIKKNHQDYLNAKASRDKTATLRKFVLLESDKDNYLNKWENLKLE